MVISQQPHVPEASIDMAVMAPPALAIRATRAASLELGCLLRTPSSGKVQTRSATQAGKGPRLQKAFSLDTGLAVHHGPHDLQPGRTGKAHPTPAAHTAGHGSDRWAWLSALGVARQQLSRLLSLTEGSAARLHPQLADKWHTAVAGRAPLGLSEFILGLHMRPRSVTAALLPFLQIIQ